MRQSYELPQDDGSRRSRCPPSHQEMALTPHYAQASARAPRPSPPSTHSLASTDKVSPHHQPGSTKPRAAPPAPRMARADPPAFGDPPGRTDGLMAPSPMSFGASTPSYSPHTSSAIVTSTRGEYTPTTRSTPPSDEATHSSRPKSSARSSCRLNLAVKTSTSRSSSSPSPPLLKRGGASLAEHRAATVLQCWKRRLWLRRWFDQQARSKERRLRLQALCRGASTYARSVGANRRPPPTPTIKPSDPTESLHPFRTRGQPLPPRKRARRPTRKRRRPGRRHRPRAPDTEGGGLRLCMPLCFWATQTAVAAAYLPSGSGRSEFSPYLPPHKAATAIQHIYRSYLRDKPLRQELAARALSHEVYVLEHNMALAMQDLRDSDHYVYSVSSTAGGGTKWTAHQARAAAPTLLQELMRSIELQLQDMDMRHWAAGW